MLRVGIDVVDVNRFRTVLKRTPSLVDRVFTTEEREYAHQAADPAERFAVRFAAKEATMKAMHVGLGAFALQDVAVVKSPSGEPSLLLAGKALALAAELGIREWALSLSHSGATAAAIVVAT